MRNTLRLYIKVGLCLILFSFSQFFFNASKAKHTNSSVLDDNRERRLQYDSDDFGKINDFSEYSVTWSIDLGGKDFLLESDFLKAGLEYSAKAVINRELACEEEFDDEALGRTSFFKVRIIDDDSVSNKAKRISGSGKCRGNATRCKKKIKKSVSDAGKYDMRKKIGGACETSIFELFKNTLITASHFNYNVTLDLINDFSGNLGLDLNVNFQESIGDGLNQIDSVVFEAEDPVEISIDCDERCLIQREEQRPIMIEIYSSFGIPFDDNLHECLFDGVNCNDEDLVTHIWLG